MSILSWFAEKMSTTAPPAAPPAIRSITMAQAGRLYGGWTTQTTSANSDLRTSLKIARTRSRDLALNNDYGKRFINLLKHNVVGPAGVTFQNKAKNASGKLDKTANDKIEAAWSRFTRKGECDVTGRLSLADACELFIATLAADGEVFLRIVKGYNNRQRIALQFIDADQVDETYNDITANGNRVIMGVEIDPWGKPAAYYVWTDHPNEQNVRQRRRERVPASEMLHEFVTERTGQLRGIPWMVASATRMQMLSGYEEAELVAARVSAAKMGFFKRTDAAADYTGEIDTASGAPIMEADPGTFEVLPSGMEFQAWDPTHPGSNFDDFMVRVLKGIAAGLGISFHTLASDYSDVNYSSGRLAELADREFYRRIQRLLIDGLLIPLYERWLSVALLTRQIELPADRIEKYNAPKFTGRGWAWVDPLKDEKANTEAIGNVTGSRTRILAEQGIDFEELLEEIAREHELAASYNIPLSAVKTPQGVMP